MMMMMMMQQRCEYGSEAMSAVTYSDAAQTMPHADV